MSGGLLGGYQPRPKPTPFQQLLDQVQRVMATAQTAGQGGPQSQPTTPNVFEPTREQKLQLLRSSSPTGQTAPYVRNDLYGGGVETYSGPQAELLPDSMNPATQMPGYTVQSGAPQMVDRGKEIQSDLIMRSIASKRGWDRGKANERADADLRARLDHLKNTYTQADYGDGDNSYQRRLVNALLWATGQGGGMR